MKKNLMLAAVAAIVATTSCKKTDEVTNPLVVQKDTVSVSFVSGAGQTLFPVDMQVSTLSLTMNVSDSVFMEFSISTNQKTKVDLDSVVMTCTNVATRSVIVVDCSNKNFIGGVMQYTTSGILNKLFVKGIYTIELKNRASIPNQTDSTDFTLKASTRIPFNVNKVVKQPQDFVSNMITFTKSKIETKLFGTMPKTGAVLTSAPTKMFSIATSAVAGGKKPLEYTFALQNPNIVDKVEVRQGSSTIGTATVNRNNTVTMALNAVNIANGSQAIYDIYIVWKTPPYAVIDKTGILTTLTLVSGRSLDLVSGQSLTESIGVTNQMYPFKSLLSISGANGIKTINSAIENDLYTMTLQGDGSIVSIGYTLTWNENGSDTIRIPLKYYVNGVDYTKKVSFTNQNGDTVSTLTSKSTKLYVYFKENPYEYIVNTSGSIRLVGNKPQGFTTSGTSLKITFDADNIVNNRTLSANSTVTRVSLGGVLANFIWSDGGDINHSPIPGNISSDDWFNSSWLIKTTTDAILVK